MSEEKQTKQGESQEPFDFRSFVEQMRKMMAGKKGECDCAPMMAVMMPICCGGERKKERPSESDRLSKNQPAEN